MADLNELSRHSLTVTQSAWQRLMLNSTYLQIIKMENTMFNLFNPSFKGNINNFTTKFEKNNHIKTQSIPISILYGTLSSLMGPVCILVVMLYKKDTSMNWH